MKNKVVYFNDKNDNIDVEIYEVGYQHKDPQHKFGPRIFEYNYLQYIVSGRGTLVVDKTAYPLDAGCLFYTNTDTVCSCFSEAENPYEYFFIGFNGSKCKKLLNQCGLSPENPVIKLFNVEIINCYNHIIDTLKSDSDSLEPGSKASRAISFLYQLFATLIETNNSGRLSPISENDHVKNAMLYMEKNFSFGIAVQDVAKNLNINRNYLSKIFKQQTGFTLINYLANLRFKKAAKLLSSTNLPFSEISILCGFSDPVSFSASFKKFSGFSPREYRKKLSESDRLIDLQQQIDHSVEESIALQLSPKAPPLPSGKSTQATAYDPILPSTME